MEHTIQRLQDKIVSQQQTIESLHHANDDLQAQLDKINQKYEKSIRSSAKFNISSVLNQQKEEKAMYYGEQRDEVIKTLEQKVSVLNWQVLQLQSINGRYEQTIVNLEQELLMHENKEYLFKAEISKLSQKIENLESAEKQIESCLKDALQKWRCANQETARVIQEKQRLQQQNEWLTARANDKIRELISSNVDMQRKLMQAGGQYQQQIEQIRETVTKLEEANKTLSESIEEKNNLMNLFLSNPEGQQFLKDKANDLHTIKCLRKQIIKKRSEMENFKNRLDRIESIKLQYQGFKKKFEEMQSMKEKIQKNNKQLKKINVDYEIKIKELEAKIVQIKHEQEENEIKLYEILLENEACHRIIFEIKGSQIYQREIADKLQMVLRDMNERNRSDDVDWRDISELVRVNRKLRQALSA